MTDELDELRAAMGAATPDPDPDKRAEILALAQKNFDHAQGSPAGARPTSERRPFGWLISGGFKMIQSISTRGGLAATTALVAFGLVIVLPQGRDFLSPPAVAPVVDGLTQPTTVVPVEPGAVTL